MLSNEHLKCNLVWTPHLKKDKLICQWQVIGSWKATLWRMTEGFWAILFGNKEVLGERGAWIVRDGRIRENLAGTKTTTWPIWMVVPERYWYLGWGWGQYPEKHPGENWVLLSLAISRKSTHLWDASHPFPTPTRLWLLLLLPVRPQKQRWLMVSKDWRQAHLQKSWGNLRKQVLWENNHKDNNL